MLLAMLLARRWMTTGSAHPARLSETLAAAL